MNKNSYELGRKLTRVGAVVGVSLTAATAAGCGPIEAAQSGFNKIVAENNMAIAEAQATTIALRQGVLDGNNNLTQTSPYGAEATPVGIINPETKTVTVQEALRGAAEKQFTKDPSRSVAEYEAMITEIYYGLPDMPFVADGTKGLMPHETQGTDFPQKAPAEKQASMRGFYAVSGGYIFAEYAGGSVSLPWQDKTTYNTYFMGALTHNTPITLTDYAAGGTFGTGASYSAGEEAKYPDRRMIDKVWVADGVMQSALRDGQGGQTYEVFVDTTTGKVTTYRYDISAKTWSVQ